MMARHSFAASRPMSPSIPWDLEILDRARLRSQTDGELFFEVVGVVGEFGLS